MLDQLKENNKREVELRGKRKEKKVEEIKLQRIGKDAFKTIEAIYIELLTSRPPLVFWKRNKSFWKEGNVKHEFF